MSEKEENMCVEEPLKGFTFHGQLVVALKDIQKYYKPAEDKVYRTFLTNPPTKIDFTPQLFRDPEKIEAANTELTPEEYAELSLKERKLYIAARGLSVNQSPEYATEAAKTSFKNVESKLGTEDAEVYMEEQRGKYVGEIRWKPGQAMISEFKHGHATVLLNEDINWGDIEVDNITEYKYKDE